MKKTILALTAVLAMAVAANAEVVPLENGGVLHGKVLPGQTTEDGLALELFETGGVVMVKWEHVLASRAKKLKHELGIEFEEEEKVYIDAHEITLVTGEKHIGLVQNPGDTSGPIRLKAKKSERDFPRDRVAGEPKVVRVDIGLIYSPEEAYQLRYDELPPEVAADHFELGLYAWRLGAYEKAKEHWEQAAADTSFLETPDGRSLANRIKQAELLVTAAGAKELVEQIKYAMARKDWNKARDSVIQLRDDYPEEILKVVQADRLATSVARGRDKYFLRAVQLKVYRVMDQLFAKKAAERKPSRIEEEEPGVATPGTLAAARQWAAREAGNLIWDKVSSDLSLEPEEVDAYWEARKLRQVKYAPYGTGSFIVIKRAKTEKKKDRRRPPGSRNQRDRRSKSGSGKKAKEEKPKTEEEWWTSVRTKDKQNWLTAHYVESSDMFEVVRVDESKSCQGCGGLGFTTSSSADGGSENHFCVQCNGSGKFRTVVYR